jgi:integrase
MKGSIRTYQKCPVCQKPFNNIPGLPISCPEHKTFPTRYFLDIYWKKQHRIFSDRDGRPLDSYQRALGLQARINHEIETHVFDPARYVRAELENFWVKNFLDRFEERKLRETAPSYQDDYSRILGRAREYFGIMDAREIRRIHLENFKDHLEAAGIRAKTLKNHLDLFKTFLRWCRAMELIDSVPSMPEVQVAPPAPRWVSQEDQIRLFGYVPEADRPLVAFLMLHGCRPAEARALRVKDVDLAGRTISISATFSGQVFREKRKGRGARPLALPIHPEAWVYIDQRVKSALPGAWLFPNPRTGQAYSEQAIRRLWEGVRQRAGISKELRLYDATRHSVASQLLNAGVSLGKIREVLGHSDIRTTQRYAHGQVESLRADLQKLSLKKVVPIREDEQKESLRNTAK